MLSGKGVFWIIKKFTRLIGGKHDQDNGQAAQQKNGRMKYAFELPGKDGAQQEGQKAHDMKGRAGHGEPAGYLGRQIHIGGLCGIGILSHRANRHTYLIKR
ncbi:MAG: hypothetical protein A4E74_00257 [Syntrophus sp. PtaB.Bin075]|nr:MAG: hypothetical protein A4E74_00257 [Syntrophus sp. PtaB.Bin075]